MQETQEHSLAAAKRVEKFDMDTLSIHPSISFVRPSVSDQIIRCCPYGAAAADTGRWGKSFLSLSLSAAPHTPQSANPQIPRKSPAARNLPSVPPAASPRLPAARFRRALVAPRKACGQPRKCC